jgi:uncharacterized repeat protein (TIGR03803 family)
MFRLKKTLSRLNLLFLTTLLAAGAPFAVAQETIIHHFFSGANNGSPPGGGLSVDGNGALYGTTEEGGDISCPWHTRGCGIVYRLTPPADGSSGWNFTILHSFTGLSDGGVPLGNLFVDSAAGVLYGTTDLGGNANGGVVYSLTLGNPGTETVLYNFQGPEGSGPSAGVTLHNGVLYGTTANGTPQHLGSLYRLVPTGSGGWQEQTLYIFGDESANGQSQSTPVFDSSGNLYGTTVGDLNGGTVYKASPPSAGETSWTFSTIYVFKNSADGEGPGPYLNIDASGALYGAVGAGPNGHGAVFKLAPPSSGTGPWTESLLYSFTGGQDGGAPSSGMVFDGQGNLYGTTAEGGNSLCSGVGCGVVFELMPPSSPDGTWTEKTLYAFQGNSDGDDPAYNLVLQGGNLYGVTVSGDLNNSGVAFQVKP